MSSSGSDNVGGNVLPCERCGTTRIITRRRICCPNCDGIPVLNIEEALSDRRKELKTVDSHFLKAMSATDYNQTFGSAILNRELAANTSIYVAPKRRNALNEWLAYTYLLHNLHYTKKNGPRTSNFPELLDLSMRIIRFHNEILSLERGLAVIVKSEDKESFEWTEFEPLSFIPEEACADSDLKPVIEGISDRDLHTDIALLQEGLMLPIQIILLSEEISRILRQCFHSRIVPFVRDPTQARKFVQISGKFSAEGKDYNTYYRRAPEDQGTILTDREGIERIKHTLWKNFHTTDVDWYLRGLIRENFGDKFDLGSSIIVRDEEVDIFCIPLYSLQMLAIANMKWMKEADLGRALNLKGEIVEDYFFRFLNAYDLSLNHPKTGKPLLRVKHPDNHALEIADIMGYNDESVLVLESKFWNAPTLGELEKELGKFKAKLDYIKSNLKKFDLDENLKVVSIFYTPYAPYPLWHGIAVLPSIIALGLKIGEIFSAKKVKLLKGTAGLQKLFNLVRGPLPFPIDASRYMERVQPDKHRIHDGLVLKYDKEEITVLIDMPVSLYGFLSYFDITYETFLELKRKGVSPGDIIRMITVNLNGTWTMVQLLLFRKIMPKSEWESDAQKAAPYRRMIYLFRYMQRGKKVRRSI